MGAPFPYRTANIGLLKIPRVCSCDHLLQIGFIPYDANGIGVDLDTIDVAAQPGLAERN